MMVPMVMVSALSLACGGLLGFKILLQLRERVLCSCQVA